MFCFKEDKMKIATQANAISTITNNNVNTKIKNEPNFRKTVVQNINFGVLEKNKKTEMFKEIELENLRQYVSDISKYIEYNAA